MSIQMSTLLTHDDDDDDDDAHYLLVMIMVVTMMMYCWEDEDRSKLGIMFSLQAG